MYIIKKNGCIFDIEFNYKIKIQSKKHNYITNSNKKNNKCDYTYN